MSRAPTYLATLLAGIVAVLVAPGCGRSRPPVHGPAASAMRTSREGGDLEYREGAVPAPAAAAAADDGDDDDDDDDDDGAAPSGDDGDDDGGDDDDGDAAAADHGGASHGEVEIEVTPDAREAAGVAAPAR